MMRNLAAGNLTLCNTLSKKIPLSERSGAKAILYFLFLRVQLLNLLLIKLSTGFTLPASCLLIQSGGYSPQSGMQEELFFLQWTKPIKRLIPYGKYILP